MQQGSLALTGVLPNARYESVPGQSHALKPKPYAPLLTRFFID
jgi:hypothetical protein